MREPNFNNAKFVKIVNKKKYRCVNKKYFYIDIKINDEINRMSNGYGIDRSFIGDTINKIFPIRDNNLIDRSINYTFSKERCFGEGRFHKSNYPVFYCAKEIQTCVSEYIFHLPSAVNKVELIVFSVEVTCCAIDIRGDFTQQRMLSEKYETFQNISKAVREKSLADCIISNSAREIGGSCCNIIDRACISAKDVEQEAVFERS